MRPIPIDMLPEHLRRQVEEKIYKPVEPRKTESNSKVGVEQESELQREAERYLARLRDVGKIIDYFHLRKAKGEREGLPDLLIFLPDNKIVYIELKSRKGKLRPKQKRFIERAERLNTEVNIARDIETVIKIMREQL